MIKRLVYKNKNQAGWPNGNWCQSISITNGYYWSTPQVYSICRNWDLKTSCYLVDPCLKEILTTEIISSYIDTFLAAPLLTSSYIVVKKIKRYRCKVSLVEINWFSYSIYFSREGSSSLLSAASGVLAWLNNTRTLTYLIENILPQPLWRHFFGKFMVLQLFC